MVTSGKKKTRLAHNKVKNTYTEDLELKSSKRRRLERSIVVEANDSPITEKGRKQNKITKILVITVTTINIQIYENTIPNDRFLYFIQCRGVNSETSRLALSRQNIVINVLAS